ncbi:MAG: ADOP family duplicated permease [Acidobacteriota bacterium]
MALRHRLAALWRNLTQGDRVERELDDELRATLGMLEDENVRAGMGPDQARRAAAIQLGGIENVKARVRDVHHGAFIETLVQDLRYAARALRRSPLFTATATLSLALGIGASTSIFTVMNALLLRAAPGVADPAGLVDLVRRARDSGPGIAEISVPALRDIRERSTTLEAVYGYRLQPSAVSLRLGDAAAEAAFASLITSNFFTALGVQPVAGRLPGPSDSEAPDGSPVIALSHAFWTRRFQRDPSIIGRAVRINGESLTVIGVVDDSFRGLSVVAPDLWIPISMTHTVMPHTDPRILDDRGMSLLTVGARLKPSASRAQASAELKAIGAALQREHASAEGFAPPRLSGVRDIASGGFVWSVEAASPIPYGLRTIVAGFLGLLMTLTSAVLLIACANLAGVLLARAVTRRREVAVRTAIGASRIRIMRQLLTETVLLFVLGGVAGLMLAQGMLALLVALLPAFSVQVNISTPLDGRVVAFALALSFVAALVSGLAPSLHASRTDVVTALKDETQGPGDRLRLRQGFVVAQIAFSIALLVVAGLLVRGFNTAVTVHPGFEPDNVEVAAIELSQAGYTSATGLVSAQRVMEAVRAQPGVESVSIGDRPPEPGGRSFGSVQVPGRPSLDARGFFNWTLVAPEFFKTVRIPILNGRDFTDGDRDGTEPVMILGEAAAKRLFGPDADAAGRYVTVQSSVRGPGGSQPAPMPVRIVGVVGDVRFGSQSVLAVYAPLAQRYAPALTLLVRRSRSEAALTTDIRQLVTALDPNVLVLSVGPLTAHGSGPVQTQLRIAAAVAASVALIGLWLASIGVYGVTAYTVSQRTREIGIRLSLGATGSDVAWLVLGQGMRLATLGSALGLLFAVGAGHLLARSRFGLPGFDATVLLSATLLFGVVCLVACAVPLARAFRINAMEALRYE